MLNAKNAEALINSNFLKHMFKNIMGLFCVLNVTLSVTSFKIFYIKMQFVKRFFFKKMQFDEGYNY